jgi:hypothetical protein
MQNSQDLDRLAVLAVLLWCARVQERKGCVKISRELLEDWEMGEIKGYGNNLRKSNNRMVSAFGTQCSAWLKAQPHAMGWGRRSRCSPTPSRLP